jgi:hypothetical protein
LTSSEKAWLCERKGDVINFLQNYSSQKTQPRQDYLEFINLALIMLGSVNSTNAAGNNEHPVPAHFTPPGTYQHARWKAKGIYCLKIYLFHVLFRLTTQEVPALRRICLFTVTIYVKAWFIATSSCDAPWNDLCLLQSLELYVEVDSQIANIALKKMRGHLWYLSEDLSGLAFFSDTVSDSEKEAMVAALQKPKPQADVRRVDPNSVVSFQTKTLSDFVTENSLHLFTALKIHLSCLHGSPSAWSQSPNYVSVKQKVMGLKVINDCAERAVKLATDFNDALIFDETLRQLVF